MQPHIPSPFEMLRESAKASPPLDPGSEQPSTLMQGTPSLTHTAESTIDPPTSPEAYEEPPQPHKKHWKRLLIPRNTIFLAYLASLLIAVSLLVAAASDKGDHYANDQLPSNENGVGFRA